MREMNTREGIFISPIGKYKILVRFSYNHDEWESGKQEAKRNFSQITFQTKASEQKTNSKIRDG